MSDTGSSSFLEVRCVLPVHLHPSRLADVRAGVEEQINARIMTYVDELGGVLLSYSDLSLRSDARSNPLHCGFIFQERPYIHFQVELKALVWLAQVGRRYVGVVTALGADHLALLVDGVFPVSVGMNLSSKHMKQWRWEQESQRWIDTSVYDPASEKADADGANADDDDNAAATTAKSEGDGDSTATPAKKLSKKELKKLERKRLRAVMLAATGRLGPGSAPYAPKAPPAGVIARGSHVRFECTNVLRTEAATIKLTGSILPSTTSASTSSTSSASASSKKHSSPDTQPLGLTGGFTFLPPVDGGLAGSNSDDQHQQQQLHQQSQSHVDESMVDMDAVMSASIAPIPDASTTSASSFTAAAESTPVAAAAAAAVHSPALSSVAAKKPLTAAQEAKYLKKKEKLEARMAAKAAANETGVSAPTHSQANGIAAAPVSEKKKKRKNAELQSNATLSDTNTAATTTADDASIEKKKKKKQKLKMEG